MKKFFIISFLFFSYLFASKILIIQNKSNFVSSNNLNQVYILDKAYREAVLLSKFSKILLNNNVFYTYSQLYEQTNVKVYTTTFLKKLNDFLKGLPPYSDTSFENNDIQAGTIEILKECLLNNYQNIPKNILNRINFSIKQMPLFSDEKKFVLKIKHLNKKSKKEFYYFMNYFVNLFTDFDNTINQINKNRCPLLFKNDQKTINEKLYKYYRIPAKTSLKKTFDIFNKYFHQNFNKVYKKLKYY